MMGTLHYMVILCMTEMLDRFNLIVRHVCMLGAFHRKVILCMTEILDGFNLNVRHACMLDVCLHW
jgi:hypothetical protein